MLVRPEHDVNVGSACRAAKNFGCTDVALVNPIAQLGFNARLYAKHSEELLEGARLCASLAGALRGCDVAVATTGVPGRFAGGLKKCLSLPKLPAFVRGYRRVALVFGPESSGLSREELDACDVVVTIPASSLHEVLNLSHSVAVVLYELYSRGATKEGAPAAGKEVAAGKAALASRGKRLLLEKAFRRISAGVPSVRDGRKVAKAFQNVLERSRVGEDEAQALLAVLGPLSRHPGLRRRSS